MNINGLIKGQYLLIPITLVYNGLIINNKNILLNIKKGVYALIKKDIIKNLREKTGAKRIKLQRPVTLKGYNGGASQGITHAIIYHLTVNSRQ